MLVKVVLPPDITTNNVPLLASICGTSQVPSKSSEVSEKPISNFKSQSILLLNNNENIMSVLNQITISISINCKYAEELCSDDQYQLFTIRLVENHELRNRVRTGQHLKDKVL